MRRLILIVFCAVSLLSFGQNSIDWKKQLDYRSDEIHPIRLQINFIPLVEAKVNDTPLWVKFDTGCSSGFSLTSAVEDKIEHTITGTSTERNPDGSYRGKTKLATISSLEVFGEKYAQVETSFTDWRIFSTLKFNGLLGLKYFQDKRVTLDYKTRKIGVSKRSFLYEGNKDDSMTVVPLLEATGGQAGLIYVGGKVRGHPTVLYLDTGSSASFIDPSILGYADIKQGQRHRLAENIGMSIGDMDFTVKQLRIQEQRREGANFEFPQTVKLGSDVLRNFLITIDKMTNQLMLRKN
jgi:hypothetical protein